ncbi:hypothetical protein ACFSB1_11875 [Halopseudomonas phragmitis]|uniref:hypothetical protein n=1 Tax=Halopseudomonas phragmitis TaxID=1931241 RepID=UPI0012BA8039|nr:hypothetical protein [Halopseudomonas phragmitis]
MSVDTTTTLPVLREVDCRWLLGLYALIPLVLLIVLLDSLPGGGWLRRSLPNDPMHWPFWTLVFGLPHIVASFVSMADRDYLQHYRRRLLWPLLGFAALSTLGYVGPQPLSYQLLFVFLAFYTIYHVLAQQLGLSLMMLGIAPSPVFRAWKWLSVLAGFAIYMNVYGATYIGRLSLGSLDIYLMLRYMAAALCAAVMVLAWQLTWQARHRIGVWYLWGNVALLLSAFVINEAGYTLFVILIPRVIHDVTAYIIYISHDSNRNRQQPVNLIYRMARVTRLPVWLLLPLLSGLIAYVLTYYQQLPLIGIVILTLSFLHYYVEGFIWRTPNPHRSYLAFKRQ